MFRINSSWPLISGLYLILCFSMTMACYFGSIHITDIFFDTYLIFERGEVFFIYIQYWRLYTSFFYLGEFNIHSIFSFLIFFEYFSELEKHAFRSRGTSYIYCIFLLSIMLIVYKKNLRDFLACGGKQSYWHVPLIQL